MPIVLAQFKQMGYIYSYPPTVGFLSSVTINNINFAFL